MPTKLNTRDAKTIKRLKELADGVVEQVGRRRDPYVDVPDRARCRTSSTTRARRFIEMGRNTNRRQLFNLSQAKTYMQTMLVASGATQLIEQGKTTSIRGLFYLLKHTIEGAKEETFADQDECDPVIEDCEVLLNSLREELHLYAQKKGDMVGDIILVDRGDEIDCSRMGSGGYGIPSIVEPEVIEFKRSSAEFILHVEKDTVWQRFNEDKFWRKHKCILTHGGGQPPRGVRRLLHRLHNELKLPVYCLLDNDPWGYYIYSVIKQGSINLAYESQRMAIPDAKFLGLRSKDFQRVPAVRQREDHAERHRPQAGQADRQLSLVRPQEGVAEGDQAAVGQRLQAGSRVVDQQGHQLRDRAIYARPVEGEGLVGLEAISRLSPAGAILLQSLNPAPPGAGFSFALRLPARTPSPGRVLDVLFQRGPFVPFRWAARGGERARGAQVRSWARQP